MRIIHIDLVEEADLLMYRTQYFKSAIGADSTLKVCALSGDV